MGGPPNVEQPFHAQTPRGRRGFPRGGCAWNGCCTLGGPPMSYKAHPEGSPLKQRHTRDAAGCMDGNAQKRPVAGSAKHSCLAANISRTMTDGWHPATRTRLRSSGRKVLGRIPAAEDADAIVYDSASNRIFT